MLNQLFSKTAQDFQQSEIQKALKLSTNKDIISFSLGMPTTELLPLKNCKNALQNLDSTSALQYSPPAKELKAQIITLMQKRNVFCNENQIFLTSGAQQAMMLLMRLLIDKNDTILIDEVTYPGFIQIAQSLQSNINSTSVNLQNGLEIEGLENILKGENLPKLIYTMSEGHNPLGISLSKEKRVQLTDLARFYKIPILEDDAYGFLNYDELQPPLKAYSEEWVFYIGSFSKILAPSLRVGWMIVPEFLMEKLEILKESFDINTATFSQRILSSYINLDYLDDHILLLRKHYKEKRDLMVKVLKEHIPEMDFIIPKSGFFIWGRLPSHINTNDLFKTAVEQKVSFLPGSSFGIKNKSYLNNCLRLSFSACPIDSIDIGIKRLAEAIRIMDR